MPDLLFIRDPVGFIDTYMPRNELNQPWSLLEHQRTVLHAAFAFDEAGHLPYDTIVYSCPKKSGKTTLNAAIAIWWSFTQESPNEILILSNDFEQASSRVFSSVSRVIKHNRSLAMSAEIQMQKIILSNGTTIIPLASDYASAAGSNHGLTSWDELWGYSSESSRRLWEELCPVPTRKNSIRFITTYAGWEGESQLLYDLYKQGVSCEEHPDGQGERLHPDLPIYANRDARLFCYWDHEPRMPWQTEKYRASQAKNLRPNTYRRLHQNDWTTAESVFVTPELWDANVDRDLHPLLPTTSVSLYVGVDASTKHDCAAVVAVFRDENRLVLALHKIWKPSPNHPLDLEATIEAYLRDLHLRYDVREIVCDPFQLHRSIMTLQSAGIRIREYPQTVTNTERMGQSLYELLKGKNLSLYPDEELRQHALNCVAIESRTGGFRLSKEKASKKIDSTVALSMACVAALERMAHAPLFFIGGGPADVDHRSVDQIQDEANVEAARLAEESAAEIQAACLATGCWWPGDPPPPNAPPQKSRLAGLRQPPDLGSLGRGQ